MAQHEDPMQDVALEEESLSPEPGGFISADDDLDEYEESIQSTGEPAEQEQQSDPEAFRQWQLEQQQRAMAIMAEEAQKRHNQMAYQLRVTSKEKKLLERRLSELEEAVRGQRSQQEIRQDEEELPDKESNPGLYLINKIEQLEKRLSQKDEEVEVKRGIQGYVKEVQNARAQAIAFREGNPQAYDEAVSHLMAVTREELEEEFPDRTEDELNSILARGLIEKMVKWRHEGKNPGEQLFRMAMRRGYNYVQGRPQQEVVPTQQRQQAPRQKPSASQLVSMQQARSKKAASLSNVPGSSPGGKGSIRKAMSLGADEYLEETKGMSLRDLLRHKAISG